MGAPYCSAKEPILARLAGRSTDELPSSSCPHGWLEAPSGRGCEDSRRVHGTTVQLPHRGAGSRTASPRWVTYPFSGQLCCQSGEGTPRRPPRTLSLALAASSTLEG